MPKQASVPTVLVALGKTEQQARKRHCKKVMRAITKINRLAKKVRKAEDKLTVLLPQPALLAKLSSVSGKLTLKKVASALYPA